MIAPILVLFGCPQPEPASVPAPAMVEPPTHKLVFRNHCAETIWVGSVGQGNSAAIGNGGWEMAPGQVSTWKAPVGSSGRIWPRTSCVFDEMTDLCHPAEMNCCRTGGCLTADGISFGLECAQSGQPPASLVEWTLDATSGWGPVDYYDISFVDGWSVPVSMQPVPGTFNTSPDPGIKAWWCEVDGCGSTPPVCPEAFKVDGSPLSCRSPCQAAVLTGSPETTKLCCACSMTSPVTCPDVACAGQYGCTPYHDPAYPADMTCDPWNPDRARAWDQLSLSYIDAVRQSCPKVYSWQFDDTQATLNCRKTGGLVDYEIEFCPDSAVPSP